MTGRNFRQLLPLYLACYALWLALAALGVWLLFALRPVVFGLAIWLRLNPWQVRALDNLSFVTFGLAWLVGILLLEHSLLRAAPRQQYPTPPTQHLLRLTPCCTTSTTTTQASA